MDINYTKLVYGVRTDVVVVDHNSEMADMSNPSGAIYADADYIVAETPTGRRFAHFMTAITGANEDGINVERLEALTFHLNETHPDLNMELWNEIDPCYGSEAYQANGCEETNRLREIQELVTAGEMSDGEAFHLSLKTFAPL